MTLPELTFPGWPQRPPGWDPPLAPPERHVPMVLPPPAEGLVEALLRRRIVLVSGPLSWELANDAAGKLMLLDADGTGAVHLHVASAGGDLGAALMLADTVALVRGRVHAYALGSVGQAALAPFAAADERVALPHALFELREPHLQASGTADELAAAAAMHQRQLATLCGWIAAASGHSPEAVAGDLRTGRLLGAAEALAYGLVGAVRNSA